jgi:hypothetical protein
VAAQRLSNEDRFRLLRGELKLSELVRRHKKPPTNDQVDRVVARLGADALMRGLDRATAPQRVAAE